MEANLEHIDELKKEIADNTRTIKLHLECYMKKALDAVRSNRKVRDTLAFRKEYYKAKKLVEKLNSYTNELLLDIKQANLLEIEIITVPFLPEIDDGLQMQFEMVFLDGSSPWHFWLGHTQKDTATKLNNLLKERLTNLQQLDESPKPGDYVLCKHNDTLVRGFVQIIHAERYLILNIDTGTPIMTRLKRLFKMDAEISLIPQQALKCTLIEDSKDSSLWTNELKELFLNSIRPCKLTVRIIGYNEEYPPHFQVELKAQNIEKDTGNTVDVGKWVTDRINPALKSGRSLSPVLDMFSIQDDKEDNSSNPLSQKSQASPTIEPPHNIREVESITGENRLEQSPEIVAVSTPPATMIKAPTSAANSDEYPRRDDDTVIQTTNVMSVNNLALPLLQNMNLMNLMNLMTGYPSSPVLPNGMPFVGYPFNMNCLFPPPPNQASGYIAANQSLRSAISRSTYALPPPPNQAFGYTAANQSLVSAISRSTTDLPPPPNHVSGYPAANQSLGSENSRSTYALPPPPNQASGYTAANQSLVSANSRSTYALPPPPNQASGYPAANQSLGSAISRSTTDLPLPPNQAFGYTAANQSLGSAISRSPYALPPPPNHVSGYPAANQSLGSAIPRSTTDFKPNQAVEQNQVLFNSKLKTPVVHVRPNEELRAICTYVVSPHEFYVQLDNENNAKVAVLQVELERFYSNCNPVDWRMNPRSKYCACKYIWCVDRPSVGHPAPHTTWYRGEVIYLRGKEAFVYLVDFGVKVFRKIEDLRNLNEHFFLLDKMAKLCHLQNVPKIEDKIDSEDVANYLTSLLITKEPLKMTVVNNSNRNSLEVVVKIHDESINDKIIKYIGMKALSREQNKWNPTASNYFAETNRLDHFNDKKLMATSGCIPMDEKTICSFYRETGRCPKLGCRQIHKLMGKDVSAVVKTETYTRRKLPGEGRIIKIKVLQNGCLSPTRFYGHWEFINDAEKNRKIVRRSYVTYMQIDYESVEYSGGEDDEGESCKETLHTLMTALNEPYNIRHYQHLNVFPLIGELVIAKKISKVGRFVWLRAKVRDVQRFGEKSCDVFLIDFGETNRIPLSDLRRMEPRFLHLPPQATQFCIAGVEELKEQWGPNESPTSIISQWEHKIIFGTVTKRNEDYVEVDLKDENGQSIRHKLHQTGKYRLVAIDVDSQKTG
ncbi:uncharacterized protein LOC111051593 isoform X2 [Nilaparvata lugens]|uniref:uncharacterized protein LOC111051593 isoform X2 n=1 Tax=Nilaparvata lugens TaxID=108931 RepID=UPI00193EA909|nr:uncharacterized protein LOC111051593 isoform X2 [Nilaparvata lugens]